VHQFGCNQWGERLTKPMFRRRFHFLAIVSVNMETSDNQSRLLQMHQTVNRN
jgi:hypothetical protein